MPCLSLTLNVTSAYEDEFEASVESAKQICMCFRLDEVNFDWLGLIVRVHSKSDTDDALDKLWEAQREEYEAVII